MDPLFYEKAHDRLVNRAKGVVYATQTDSRRHYRIES